MATARAQSSLSAARTAPNDARTQYEAWRMALRLTASGAHIRVRRRSRGDGSPAGRHAHTRVEQLRSMRCWSNAPSLYWGTCEGYERMVNASRRRFSFIACINPIHLPSTLPVWGRRTLNVYRMRSQGAPMLRGGPPMHSRERQLPVQTEDDRAAARQVLHAPGGHAVNCSRHESQLAIFAPARAVADTCQHGSRRTLCNSSGPARVRGAEGPDDCRGPTRAERAGQCC